ncbi:MAG: HAD-IIB family hydrolase [Acidimicrobiia bacterium]
MTKLIVCDFDGTSSSHVEKASDARLHERFEPFIDQFTGQGNLFAFLTGRDAGFLYSVLPRDIRDKVAIFGNHGLSSISAEGDLIISDDFMHFAGATDDLYQVIDKYKPNGLPEIVEHKTLGLVVHLRWLSEEQRASLLKIIEDLAKSNHESFSKFQLHECDGVIEFRPDVEHDKGSSLRSIFEKLSEPVESLTYCGDDLPDIPAFIAADEIRAEEGIGGENLLVVRKGSSIDLLTDEELAAFTSIRLNDIDALVNRLGSRFLETGKSFS